MESIVQEKFIIYVHEKKRDMLKIFGGTKRSRASLQHKGNEHSLKKLL